MYDNLKLIQSKINSEQDLPISHNHSDKINHYEQILTRIYGNIKQVKQSMHILQKSQPSQSQEPSSNVSSLNQDIQRNHIALKNMIDMIDNRPSTRFTDRMSGISTNRPERTNRFMLQNNREQKEYKKSVRKDLEQVRDNLRKVIDLIDTKLKKNDSSFQLQSGEELGRIKKNVRKQIIKLDKQSYNNQELNDSGILVMPRLKSFPSQLSSNQYVQSGSNLTQQSQNQGQQYLNLKVSFDRMNELQPRKGNISPLGRSTEFQTPQFTPQSPRGYILPVKITNTPVHKLQFDSNRLHSQLNDTHRNINTTSPRIITQNIHSYRHGPHIPLASNRPFSPPQHRPQSTSPRSIKFNYHSQQKTEKQKYVRPTLKQSEYTLVGSDVIDSSSYGINYLKKSFKPKVKYSFCKPPPEKQIQELIIEQVYNRHQQIDFPHPFISEDKTLDNPFINWDHRKESKPQMLNSKISLKSILEVSEESRRMEDMYQSRNSQNIDEQPTFQFNSGIHRKKGIKLTYPTYQTQYFPQY